MRALLRSGVQNISIHAPPRGATALPGAGNQARHISIHAPPRGATPRLRHQQHGRAFQFTPLREGRRLQVLRQFLHLLAFQFTPLREGRPGRYLVEEGAMNFNSRPSARGDAALSEKAGISKTFQFTPLREGRPRCSALYASGLHFNSRPSARGDEAKRSRRQTTLIISIHAPPRGATPPRPADAPKPVISIHAPPRGATRSSCGSIVQTAFQFTPLREGRLSASSPKS